MAVRERHSSPPLRGIHADRGAPTVRTLGIGRMCSICGTTLSRYNPLDVCSAHTVQGHPPCAFAGCDRGAKTRGYCARHYRILWKSGALPLLRSKA